MNELRINVTELLNNLGKELKLTKEKEFSPIQTSFREINFAKPLKFNLTLRNIGYGLLTKGEISSELKLTCSRCLEDFVTPFQVEVEEVFRPEEEVLKIVSGTIDLGPLTEQTFVLNLPLKTLCRDNCLGLCPRCGKNLNKGKCNCSPSPRTFSFPISTQIKKLKRE